MAKKDKSSTKKKAAEIDQPERLESELSERTLEGTPERAVRFLVAAAKSPRIMGQMRLGGYDADDQRTGWTLLEPLLIPSSSVTAAGATPQSAAVTEIDAWDEPNVPIVRSVLTGDLQVVGDYVVGGVEPQRGPASIGVLVHILDRVTSVEKLDDAAKQAGIDAALSRAAMAKLVKRKFTPEERQRLAALVTLAQTAATPLEIDETADDEHHNKLVRLRQWLDEAASIAGKYVTRKDDRISLGLAKRSKSSDAAPPTPPADPGTTPTK